MQEKITKIVVDRNLCIGAASCVIIASSVFELDSENKAIIIQKGGIKNSGPAEKNNLSDEIVLDETLVLAAQSCPTKAIFIYGEGEKQIYP